MAKEESWRSSGSAEPEDRDTAADKLFENMLSQKDAGGKLIGSVRIGDKTLSGIMNHFDRSGANMIVLGFTVAPGVSVLWTGRRVQAVVSEPAPDIARIEDNNTPLNITTVFD